MEYVFRLDPAPFPLPIGITVSLREIADHKKSNLEFEFQVAFK
jgi:hypothetical protein